MFNGPAGGSNGKEFRLSFHLIKLCPAKTVSTSFARPKDRFCKNGILHILRFDQFSTTKDIERVIRITFITPLIAKFVPQNKKAKKPAQTLCSIVVAV